MTDDPAWGVAEDCPPAAIWQLYEAREADGALSVWRTKNDDEAVSVAAGDALQKGGAIEDIAYLAIAEEYLKTGNFSLINKAASTPLADINQKHVDIRDVGGKKLIEFVRLAKKFGEVRVVTKRQIQRRIAERLSSGALTSKSFKVGKEQVAQMVYNLWKDGVLSLAANSN